MPRSVWTINASGITPPGSYASMNLVGCHIIQNDAQTVCEFTAPNINNVLATVGPPLPFPINFQFFYQGLNWNISVTALAIGGNVSGAWSTPGTLETDGTANPQNGSYTAQSGVGMEEDAAASSAKA